MKVISWNVNGIRAIAKKGDLERMIDTYDPDILCLQEIRCDDKIATDLLKEKYVNVYEHVSFNTSKDRKGYSGTAILSKMVPNFIWMDLLGSVGSCLKEREGRVISHVYDNFVLVNVYTPNSGPGTLARLNYRVSTWDVAFGEHILELSRMYPDHSMVVCGDLNVARHAIDIHNAKSNVKSAGFTITERDSFEKNVIGKTNLVDAFRFVRPLEVKYSWWSMLGKAREKNKGWRIDYFLVSESLLPKSKKPQKKFDCDVLDDVLGSDHAPVMLTCSKLNGA